MAPKQKYRKKELDLENGWSDDTVWALDSSSLLWSAATGDAAAAAAVYYYILNHRTSNQPVTKRHVYHA